MTSEILSIIKYIEEEKAKRKIIPTHALDIEIFKVLRTRAQAALKEIKNQGIVKEYECLNYKAYEFT